MDGQTKYFGENGFFIESKSVYENLEINDLANKTGFIDILKNPQNGLSDYMTFCKEAGNTGIAKWIMDLEKLTCTYLDKAGDIVLTEKVDFKM